MIRCLKEWRGELVGLQKPFTILIDHKNLKYFIKTCKLTERHVRWLEVLLDFNINLKFRAGKEGARPDALCRRSQDVPTLKEDQRLRE